MCDRCHVLHQVPCPAATPAATAEPAPSASQPFIPGPGGNWQVVKGRYKVIDNPDDGTHASIEEAAVAMGYAWPPIVAHHYRLAAGH